MRIEGRRGPLTREIGLNVPEPSRKPAILILEDEVVVQKVIETILATRGVECDSAGSLSEAREIMSAKHFDIALVDVNLPDGSGLAFVEGAEPDDPLLIVITGSDDIQTAVEAIRKGAVDFITKPFSKNDFVKRIDKVLDEWRTRIKTKGYARALETLVRLKSEELRSSNRKVDDVYDMTITALGAALNLKDHETADHCSRVSENSATLGKVFALSDFELRNLRWGAYLHDVGKIGVPEQILLKTGDLLPEEWEVMKRHPLLGHAMIRNIEFLRFATDVVLYHHERYNGSGYPYGLKGEQIPFDARVFAILDTLDAMTSDRPYRGALPFAAAKEEIQKEAGSMFDPDIVDAFADVPETAWLIQDRATVQSLSKE